MVHNSYTFEKDKTETYFFLIKLNRNFIFQVGIARIVNNLPNHFDFVSSHNILKKNI